MGIQTNNWMQVNLALLYFCLQTVESIEFAFIFSLIYWYTTIKLILEML